MSKTTDRRVLRPMNLRCRICNSVSHGEIAGDFGDHSQAAFYEESDGLGYLCHSCYTSVTGAIDDFSIDDEFDEDDDYFDYYEDDLDD